MNATKPKTPARELMEGVRDLKQAEAMDASGDFVMAAWVKRDAMKKIDPQRKPASLEDVRATGAIAEHYVESGRGELSVRLVDTAMAPSVLAASAQVARMQLAENAGCLDLSSDVAATVRPSNSLERMLADQLSACHSHGMKLMARAAGWTEAAERSDHKRHSDTSAAAVEAARLTNAAARMMGQFNEGLLTLTKLRNGGQQQVTVVHQHVAVGDGGQAVVAGTMHRGRGRKREGGLS